MENIMWRWLHVKYEIGRMRDATIRKIVWHLPKRIIMWSYYRVAAHATTGQYGNTIVPELGMMDAIDRWPVK